MSAVVVVAQPWLYRRKISVQTPDADDAEPPLDELSSRPRRRRGISFCRPRSSSLSNLRPKIIFVLFVRSLLRRRRQAILRHDLCLGGLALGLGRLLAADAAALEDGLAILVELELSDDHVAGVDAEGDALAVGLLAGHALNVDHVFEAVHRRDLALLVLVGAADDHDLVVLADGDAADLWGGKRSASGGMAAGKVGIAYVVLLTELLAERGAHDLAADARRRAEVRLARLASRRMEGCGHFVNFGIGGSGGGDAHSW